MKGQSAQINKVIANFIPKKSQSSAIITGIIVVVIAIGATAIYITQRQEGGEVNDLSLVKEFYEILKAYIRDESSPTPLRELRKYYADFVIDARKLRPEIINQAKIEFLNRQKCPSQLSFTIWFRPFKYEEYDFSSRKWVKKTPRYIYLSPEEEDLFSSIFFKEYQSGFLFDYDFESKISYGPKIYHVIYKYYGGNDGEGRLAPGVLELDIGRSERRQCE